MALLLNNYICESYYYEYIARLTPKKFVADDVVESGHNCLLSLYSLLYTIMIPKDLLPQTDASHQ